MALQPGLIIMKTNNKRKSIYIITATLPLHLNLKPLYLPIC